MEHSITLGSLPTHYTEYGSGTAVLILHGWGSSASTWKDVQEYFSSHGYRAIALDLPGFGKSAEPPREWGLAEYTDFIRSFVDQEKIGRFVLVGHSFGGRIAIDYAARYGEGVVALILCASAGIIRSRSLKRSIFALIARVGSMVTSISFLGSVKAFARKAMYVVVGERDYYNASPVMKEVMRRVLETPLAHLLPRISQPTLLAWGDADEATPLSHARMAHQLLPDSTLAIFEGRGHSLQREIPQDLAGRIIQFLTEKNIQP